MLAELPSLGVLRDRDRLLARPRVDAGYTATIGLTREQARALIAAADADHGRARLRSAAMIWLLLHSALRVDEMPGADVADLGVDRGHRVLTVLGKGNRCAKVPLSPATPADPAHLPGGPRHPYRVRRVARDGRPAAGHHLRWADAAQPAVGAGVTAGCGGGYRRVGAVVGALAAPYRHHHGAGRRGSAARRAGPRPPPRHPHHPPLLPLPRQPGPATASAGGALIPPSMPRGPRWIQQMRIVPPAIPSIPTRTCSHRSRCTIVSDSRDHHADTDTQTSLDDSDDQQRRSGGMTSTMVGRPAGQPGASAGKEGSFTIARNRRAVRHEEHR